MVNIIQKNLSTHYKCPKGALSKGYNHYDMHPHTAKVVAR